MWEKGKSQLRVFGSRRKAKIMTKTNITKLKSMIDGRSGISTNCSKAQVQPISNCVYNSAIHKYCLPKKTVHFSKCPSYKHVLADCVENFMGVIS